MTALRIAVAIVLVGTLALSGGCEPASESPSQGAPDSTEPVTEPKPAKTTPEPPPAIAPEPQPEQSKEKSPTASPEEGTVAEMPTVVPVPGEEGFPTGREELEVVEEHWPSGALKSKKQVKRGEGGVEIGHGTYESWYETGQPQARGGFKDGDREGLWIYWHSTGEKKAEGLWSKKGIQGLWVYWYETGQKKLERTWVDGIPNGPQVLWYESGQKAREEGFLDGKSHGVIRSWHENGDPMPEVRFENGRRVKDDSPGTTTEPKPDD